MLEEKPPSWLVPATAVGGFLLLTVKPLCDWLMGYVRSWRDSRLATRRVVDTLDARSAWDRGFAASQRIRDILVELEQRTDVRRALLIKSENGGGVPSNPASPVYTTILDESHHRDLLSVMPWRRVPVVEPYYTEMLRTIYAHGSAEFVVSEMQVLDPVRAYHEADGTEVSLVFRVLVSPSAMFYLNLHLANGAARPDLRAAGQSAARRLEGLLSNFVDLVVKGADA
jgi:hypothetical protein